MIRLASKVSECDNQFESKVKLKHRTCIYLKKDVVKYDQFGPVAMEEGATTSLTSTGPDPQGATPNLVPIPLIPACRSR